ncbi:hypothetical protein BG004_006324 [Podila humilis]|nr:hypothetical protein BG004_006324 [Podila humilis]
MLIISTSKAAMVLGAVALSVYSALAAPLEFTLDSSNLAAPELTALSRPNKPFYQRVGHFFDNGRQDYEEQDEETEIEPETETENEQPTDNIWDDEDDADIEIYKSKQPNTPPDSQPSDPFASYTYQSSLPSEFRGTPTRRTIVIGDIHGSLAGFEGFLNQVGYDGSKDRLILAGDLVAKGPHSLKVIDKALQLNAECVRGNHDDKVIRWRGYLDSLNTTQFAALDLDSKSRPDVLDIDALPEYDPERPELKPRSQMRSIPADLVENSEHHRIAKQLTKEQYQYLVGCPLILSLPKELSVKKVPVYVIHAGIDPSVALNEQQPWSLLNIRNLLKDGTPYRKKKKGHGWAKVFNNIMSSKKQFMIVYGHDAGRSLNVKDWSIGLDSGCTYGRSLSGYVVETGQIYTIPCPPIDATNEDDDM